MKDTPTVIQIAGTGYCGSSLLTLFLDSQSDIRGLGELHYVYQPDEETAYCICNNIVDACSFYGSIDRSQTYKECFSKYQCSVIVDASKWYRGEMLDIDYPILAVILSKNPHEYAYSELQHRKIESGDREAIATIFSEYLNCYSARLRMYKQKGIPVFKLTYRDLILSKEKVIQTLCEICDVGFSVELLDTCWDTDTHMICGNTSVRSQMQNQHQFFSQGGKYHGKYRQIFLDEKWREDMQFVHQCKYLYTQMYDEFQELLPSIGQPTVSELLSEMECISKGEHRELELCV